MILYISFSFSSFLRSCSFIHSYIYSFIHSVGLVMVISKYPNIRIIELTLKLRSIINCISPDSFVFFLHGNDVAHAYAHTYIPKLRYFRTKRSHHRHHQTQRNSNNRVVHRTEEWWKRIRRGQNSEEINVYVMMTRQK